MGMLSLPGQKIVSDDLSRSVVSMWTQDSIPPNHFYRTGFEAIFFNSSSLQALDCVLSSAIPHGKEMLITGKGFLGDIAERADKLDISAICFEAAPQEIPLMNTLLPRYPEISHLVLVVADNKEPIAEYIRYLSPILRMSDIELILYCRTPVQKVKERTCGMVDFMIGGWNNLPDQSFVVARRSKLVQTEGNARSLNFDLHAHWQGTIKSRESNIAPVEM
ncbi:2-aminoethylphosphonate--pyruvate aminotransferase [Thermophagus sp. OGC60D27]|uniref:2-aminoethylphosphonate--pyruvate aminotransferase n=1 Tax=Thermophagus sp. OGC60D27 TaxID=3458415 RepID=UPI0040382DB2